MNAQNLFKKLLVAFLLITFIEKSMSIVWKEKNGGCCENSDLQKGSFVCWLFCFFLNVDSSFDGNWLLETLSEYCILLQVFSRPMSFSLLDPLRLGRQNFLLVIIFKWSYWTLRDLVVSNLYFETLWVPPLSS